MEKEERSQMTGRAQENFGKVHWRLGSSVEAEKSFSEAGNNFQGHRDAAGEQEHHLHDGHLLHGLCLLLPPDQGRGKYPFSEKVRTSKGRPTFSAASLTCLTLSPSRAPVSLCQNLSFDVRKYYFLILLPFRIKETTFENQCLIPVKGFGLRSAGTTTPRKGWPR